MLEYGKPNVDDCSGGVIDVPPVEPKEVVLDGNIATCSPIDVPEMAQPVLMIDLSSKAEPVGPTARGGSCPLPTPANIFSPPRRTPPRGATTSAHPPRLQCRRFLLSTPRRRAHSRQNFSSSYWTSSSPAISR